MKRLKGALIYPTELFDDVFLQGAPETLQGNCSRRLFQYQS